MDYRKIDETHIIARLDKGEEIVETLKVIAQKEHVNLAMIQGLGAVCEIVVGVFDVMAKKYKANQFTGNFEIVSLTGTIDSMQGNYYSHFHISVGDELGHVFGGHLNRAVISATGEVIITLMKGETDRKYSETIGLNLLEFA
jgi:uncharacterized protein